MNSEEIGGPIAEIVSIGDELTSGQRLDTNSQWLGQQLADIGIRALFHTTVADDFDAMMEVFRIASRRAAIVLVTGGLGPTADDLTRQVIADVAGVELWQDEETIRHIRHRFESRDREMPVSNRVQAQFPIGAQVIPNHGGTAPGVDIQLTSDDNNCRLFALPGVPAELKPMWTGYIRPQILAQYPTSGLFVHHAIHCFGLAESDVDLRLPDLINRDRVPLVGITATKATITLRISAFGKTHEECQTLIQPTARLIRDELGDLVFGENEITLPEVVLAQLREQNRTLSVIDMGCCGLIAEWMHAADSLGEIYKGMLTVTDNDASVPELLKTARTVFASDIVLLIGSPFEHSNSTKRNVTIFTKNAEIKHRFGLLPNSSIVVPHSIKQALNLLRLAIEREKI